MLWLGWGGVVVFDEEVFDVSIHHGRPASTFGVVPIQVDPGNFFPCPVSGDIVVCEKCLEEMVCMVFLGVLDAKVIHDEDKDQWAPGVSPEAGCDSALVVSVFS